MEDADASGTAELLALIGALCEQRCGRCAGHFVSANGWGTEASPHAGNARCFAVAGLPPFAAAPRREQQERAAAVALLNG